MKRLARRIHFALGLALTAVPLAAPRAQGATALAPIEDVEHEADLAASGDAEKELARSLEALRQARENRKARGPLAPRAPGHGYDIEDLDQGEVEPRIVNGTLTWKYPSAGALIKGASAASAGSWCTGTLVGCDLFLTARHCVEDDPIPTSYHVFLQHGGIHGVTKVSPAHPDYHFPFADLAVLKLERPVEGIRPTRLFAGAESLAAGTPARIVGFGRTGGNRGDYGLKRVGTVTTAACDEDEQGLLCWDFTAPVGLPGEDSNTCNADSGGPLLVAPPNAAARVLAGVTSGGTRSDCLAGDHSYDVDVRQFAEWIRQQSGPGLEAAACGSLPFVGQQGTRVFGSRVDLSPSEEQDFEFEVPADVALVRVTVNGEDLTDSLDRPTTNVDLRVKGPAGAAPECVQEGRSQYGDCPFESPAAGTWSVRVSNKGTVPATAQVSAALFTRP